MVRLWIDVLTPKQALFAKALVQRAPSNVKCLVTTRDYAELNSFVDQIKLKNTSIGKHGGGDLLEKLKSSIERQKGLVQFAQDGRFDKSLCFLSPEAARVSFGLGIEHIVCSDSPHAWAPCKLVVPLSSELFSPYVIRKERWTRYGIEKILGYHALDPWAWLNGSKYQNQVSEKVVGRVVIRLEEWFASYFRRGRGVSDTLSLLISKIRKLGDYEILLLPRYDEQREWARKRFGSECKVPETTVDAANEISKSDLLIGGGATMTQEAALLGVPNISYFPSAKLDVFYDYYFPKGLSTDAATPSQLVKETARMLRNIDSEKRLFSRRAARETSKFEDPVKFIFSRLLP